MKEFNQGIKQKKDKRKIAIAFLLGLLAICLLFGSLFSFFSDVVNGTGEATSGTLDIQGKYTMTVNGEDVADFNIKNLNPGDIVVVQASVTNSGNKSAWIRDQIVITGDLLAYVEVYEGVVKLEDIEEKTTIDLTDDKYSSTEKIINGTGSNAEEENDAVEKFTSAYTIYFPKEAGNVSQGKNLAFIIATQAIQYRNNIETPSETTWSTVVTTSFGE